MYHSKIWLITEVVVCLPHVPAIKVTSSIAKIDGPVALIVLNIIWNRVNVLVSLDVNFVSVQGYIDLRWKGWIQDKKRKEKQTYWVGFGFSIHDKWAVNAFLVRYFPMIFRFLVVAVLGLNHCGTNCLLTEACWG